MDLEIDHAKNTRATGPAPQRVQPAPPRIGLVSGGLGAYWPQFPDLLDRVRGSTETVAARLRLLGAEVIDAGFVDVPEAAGPAGDRLREAGCDLVFFHIPTYLTSSLVLPVVQRAGAPFVFLNLQPGSSMADEDRLETGRCLAWCGACPLPEMGNALQRADIPFRSISGHLGDERAWDRVANWVRAAAVSSVLRRGRFGTARSHLRVCRDAD